VFLLNAVLHAVHIPQGYFTGPEASFRRPSEHPRDTENDGCLYLQNNAQLIFILAELSLKDEWLIARKKIGRL
jgi:hypothetical protein